MENTQLIYPKEAYKIQGAIFEVYKNMGCGFLEDVYQECLEKEFDLQSIPYIQQHQLPLKYKGKTLKKKYISDFICYDKIIVELKAVDEINNRHKAQVINYLRATDYKLGLLANFGTYPKVNITRLVNY